MSDKISDTMRGWRDVHWCDIGNEPVIVEYRKYGGAETKWCVCCGGPMDADDENTLHPFQFHINKPVRL